MSACKACLHMSAWTVWAQLPNVFATLPWQTFIMCNTVHGTQYVSVKNCLSPQHNVLRTHSLIKQPIYCSSIHKEDAAPQATGPGLQIRGKTDLQTDNSFPIFTGYSSFSAVLPHLELDVLLLEAQHLSLSSSDLLCNQVHACHHLGHRVLHLQATPLPFIPYQGQVGCVRWCLTSERPQC